MGEVINLTNTSGDIWSGEISNTLLPNPGVYRLLVSAYSPNNPGWWLYDYVNVLVSVPVYQDRITFASDRYVNWDIFLVNPDGTGLEQLTTEDSNDEYPDFCPFERKIIFVSDRDAHPGIPPNNVINELYIYDIDSGGTSKISVVCKALYPDWSPSGIIPSSSYGLFITSYLECLPSEAEKYMGYIDIDTSEVEYLPIGYYTQLRTNPEFSPDGSKVMFAEYALGEWKVHEYDFPTGDNEVTLTDFGMEFDCTYSPDGSMIAYASTRKDNADIYIMNLASHVETRVTDDIESDTHPAFSPDGQRIAFVSYRDNGLHSDIYITNLTGDYFFNITNNPTSDDVSPSWSNNIF
jgi:Tol biopolymer transport system component